MRGMWYVEYTEDALEFNKSTTIRDDRRHLIMRFSGRGLSQKSIAEGLSFGQLRTEHPYLAGAACGAGRGVVSFF